MKYLAIVALIVLPSGALADSCQKAGEDYVSFWANYGTDKFPRSIEADRQKIRERNNIIEGCMPGGFYDEMDNLTQNINESCRRSGMLDCK